MDGRKRSNRTAQSRRESIYRGRERAKRKTKHSELEAAKNVLRRHGKTVFDAPIDEGRRAKGLIRVDTRKLAAAAVIEMAAVILERERLRNDELRAQHGLGPKREGK